MPIAVPVRKVRFNFAVPLNDRGDYSPEWTKDRVNDLVVFPDSRLARCTLRGTDRPIVASFAYYEPMSLEDQLNWESDGQQFKCDVCGQTFENSQGLGKHRVTKHPEATSGK